ncbi:MAG: response regulator [Bacteroidota bacterium]
MSLKNLTPFRIILVENNPSDILLFREAFSETSYRVQVDAVSSGGELMDILSTQQKSEAQPNLIILDLNMPKEKGQEILGKLKENTETRRIPVIIFTTSEAMPDVVACYDSFANGYIVKPMDFQRYVEIVKVLGEYWIGTNVSENWSPNIDE